MLLRYKLGSLFPFVKYTNNLCEWAKKSKVTVLNYHAIPERNIENFKEQIEWVNDRYNIITPLEFNRFLKNNHTLNGHNIMITFDDGFLSSYKAIKQVLTPLGIKTLLFIPTGFVKRDRLGSWKKYVADNIYNGRLEEQNIEDYHCPMEYKQLKELLLDGHIIGGHTVSHKNLRLIKENKVLKNELLDSKHELENYFGIKIDSVAFPFGGIEHIDTKALLLIKNNYTYSYSNIRGTNTKDSDPIFIYRQNVIPDMPSNYLGLTIERGLSWYWFNDRKQLESMIV